MEPENEVIEYKQVNLPSVVLKAWQTVGGKTNHRIHQAPWEDLGVCVEKQRLIIVGIPYKPK
jgi:hypothetical protein